MFWLKRMWFAAILIILVAPVYGDEESKSKIADIIGNAATLLVSNDQIGLLFSGSLEEEYGLSDDAAQTSRVQEIGGKILKANNISSKYDFKVLSNDMFNAVSVYGGHIRVFQGLVNDTRNSDSELAEVLAHEIAHNELGHNREAVKTFKIACLLDLAGLDEKIPELVALAAQAALAKRSRVHEEAADRQGFIWSAKQGYNPTGAIAIFRRIEAEYKIEQEKEGGDELVKRFAMIFSTHPAPAKRVKAAEDFLFMQKYGRTFTEVAGTSSIKLAPPPSKKTIAGDLPVIMAHPGEWGSPLTIVSQLNGVGLFNPSSLIQNQAEMEFRAYLNPLNQGIGICATGDNDYHAAKEILEKLNFTFIDSTELNREGLLAGILAGHTYASLDGISIAKANFPIGRDYPKVKQVKMEFTLDLSFTSTTAPKIKVIRNGKVVGELKKTNSHLERNAVYKFEDKKLAPGFYWYVLANPSLLVTSPITYEVTGKDEDPIDLPSNEHWHKGIIHCHSRYSDGESTLNEVWASKGDAEFILMSDHADAFDKETKYKQYVAECLMVSSLLIPGVEYTLNGGELRHLLILGLKDYLAYKAMDEAEFFGMQDQDKVLIVEGPFHLGDDVEQREMHRDATFEYTPKDAVVRFRVKGTPFKDPILWINRQEIGRVVTTDNEWHDFEFNVPKAFLKAGTNLFHIQSYIPDRWQTFDDCEVADIWIYKKP